MIIPVLKHIVVRGEPECADDFILSANADIGTKDEEGVEYFYFRIISSKRLLSMLKEDSIIDCRATFIVNEFTIELIEREINKILEDCVRSTWEEVAQAINRYLCWEYDNIKYETV